MNSHELEKALASLTIPQQEAVNWNAGPLLVLAGPGSGKTRVLTARIAKILTDSPDKSFRILALTFTNKAAEEMTSRVLALSPGLEHRALIGTFHSFCMQIIQQHGSHLGIKPDFTIYSLESDRQEILRQAIRRTKGLDQADDKYLGLIDKLKARLINPEETYLKFADQNAGRRVGLIYRAYEDELSKANALDFGSLIAKAYELISSFPGVGIRYRKTYSYWLIDEFQDTNDAQYKLIKALAGDKFSNIMAVADDDQIIYQWNGASFKQIQRFRADFEPELIQLPTNYRCPPVIVEAANSLVTNNAQRTSSKLRLEAGKKILRYPNCDQLRLCRYSDENAEAAGVAKRISELGKTSWEETVVLGRTRALLEKTKDALGHLNVPAAIAQRRDDFRSPQFQWMNAAIRQVSRPLDRRNFETLISAFNRWFDSSISADMIFSEAEGSTRSYLEEWALAVPLETSSATAIRMAEFARTLSQEPNKFRKFIENVLAEFTVDDDPGSDISEDHAAWHDLIRSIGQTIGKEAPLEQFLQELSIRSKEPPVKAGTVTLMTIHGAKGKEFDYVFLIGLAEDILPSFQSKKAGDTSAEMEEERRNCFVAITRTREQLCISWADRYRGYTKLPSRFIQEMGLSFPKRAE